MKNLFLMLFLSFAMPVFAVDTACIENQSSQVRFYDVRTDNCEEMARETKKEIMKHCGVPAADIEIVAIDLYRVRALDRMHAFLRIQPGNIGVDPAGTITPHVFDAAPDSPEVTRKGEVVGIIQ